MRPFQRFTRNARVAVMLAHEGARELCDREPVRSTYFSGSCRPGVRSCRRC
jgi:hypothetical protein